MSTHFLFLSPTLRLTCCLPLSHKHTDTLTLTHGKPESLLSVQLWAVFPSPWPFPAQTMLCVPQRKLSSRLWGPVWPSAAPQTPERPPEPPHHNLLRCQEEHLCDSGEETLQKFSHWEEECCLDSSVCEFLSQPVYVWVCASVHERASSGSWESPSTDNKWCERKDSVHCQTFPVNEPRVQAAGLPTIDSEMGSH